MQREISSNRLARQIIEVADLSVFFEANRHRIAPNSVAGLKDEVDRLVEIDLTRAEPLALATQSLAALMEDPISLGFGDAAVAQVHHFAGRLDEAEPLFLSAIQKLKSAGRTGEAAAIERQLVGLLHRQGRSQEALDLARRTRRTLKRTGNNRLLAQLENNIGIVHYHAEEYRQALTSFERSRRIAEDLDDTRTLAVVEHNRANVLLELDLPHDAIALYARAERINIDQGRQRLATQNSYLMAFSLAALGRYGEALRRFYAARERFVELGDPVSAAWAGLYLASVYVRLNVVDEAAELADQVFDEFSAFEHTELEAARTLVIRAQIHERRRRFDAAASDLRAAQETFDRHALETLGGDARLSRAELAIATGDLATALSLAREAERIFTRTGLGGRHARAQFVEALARRAMGETGKAIRLARRVLKTAVKVSDPWLECRAETLVGELEIDRGRTSHGIKALERAVAGVERLRLRLRPGEARAAFLADKLPAYERLVVANLERKDVDGLRAAFRYVEMAKSRALADLMAQHLRSTTTVLPKRESRVREQLAHRLQELSWYSSRIDDEHEKGEQRNARLDAHLRSEVDRCERDLASLFRRLEVEDSNLAGLFAAEPAGLDELSRSLADDEVAIEFFISGDDVSAFVVTQTGSAAFPALADRKRIETHLTALRFQFEKFALGANYTAGHKLALRRSADSHLEALHGLLIKPLGTLIDGKHLLVIPHGLLHYLPFHALRTRGGRYLIQDHEVSYSPSATVHLLCQNRQSPTHEASTILAVGLSDEKTPHINEELASIGRAFRKPVLLEGKNAVKDAFIQHAPNSRILHLATHGYFRQDNPMFSSVRLWDGPLNFYDVFDLGLTAELVTLSACNTGINKLAPGDELCGLMRGFLYAGVPSLLASLWAVNDRSTSEIMQSFYTEIQKGATKRAAIRHAELEALERYGHPYYWAPFVLMGKNEWAR